jgi:hypothetical protein
MNKLTPSTVADYWTSGYLIQIRNLGKKSKNDKRNETKSRQADEDDDVKDGDDGEDDQKEEKIEGGEDGESDNDIEKTIKSELEAGNQPPGKLIID